LGGIFAGGSSSAFGSRSGNVLTKATTILGALFFVLSFSLALINRTPGGSGVEAAGRQFSSEANSTWWLEDNTAAPENSFVLPETEIPGTSGEEEVETSE
jgi:preprotein translocase subunit SecG